MVFNKLSRAGIRSIVDIRLSEVQKRLRSNGKNITLAVDNEAMDYLASVGYHPTYGARPLARAIQTELLNPLSKLIIGKGTGCIPRFEVRLIFFFFA